MAGRLEGKVIIVTGASRGLGQYCAVEYGRQGASVAVAARTEQVRDPRLPGTIHDTAKMVDEAGGKGFAVACNVAEHESVMAMVERVIERFGHVDVLMNNAGIQAPGNCSTIELRHWDLEMRINVNGMFYGTRAVLPHMTERGEGNIINISSVAAEMSRSGAYGVSKVAVEGFTERLAEEVQEQGIAVNCLKPVGSVATPGMFFTREQDAPSLDEADPLRDRYVEAAVLLAEQTVASCTGSIFNDAQAVESLADSETKARFAGL
ncbi:MAG: SDR family oxidoreductase [Dehalococcoidia bacterium]|jgi:NAD(P)-dependent dehydrogenase (short-subunit alcohol dehydrogenase family)|nr:SDR family oxidoreductase [Dehalococcoidia bacterium]